MLSPDRATLFSVSPPGSADLSVQIGALRLRNPVLAASGTFGYGVEFSHLVDLNQLGGLVTKGLSREPIKGAPAPRLCETPCGMLNAVGLQNVGVRAFVAEKLPALRQFQTAIVANVFGYSIEDYIEVIRVLEDAEGVSAYELNISCPNVKEGGIQFGSSSKQVAEVISAVMRLALRRPLWVKLSPQTVGIGSIARAAEDSGAAALTVANTYPAMSVDIKTRKSRLGSLTGGLSGPAIKPITLALVRECCRVVRIPIIGLGGIEIAEDVIEYLIVGATAVQVGTASFADPRATAAISAGVGKLCVELKVSRISDLSGCLGEKST